MIYQILVHLQLKALKDLKINYITVHINGGLKCLKVKKV